MTRFRAGSRQVSGTGASLPGGSTLRVRSSSLYVSLSRGNLRLMSIRGVGMTGLSRDLGKPQEERLGPQVWV